MYEDTNNSERIHFADHLSGGVSHILGKKYELTIEKLRAPRPSCNISAFV